MHNSTWLKLITGVRLLLAEHEVVHDERLIRVAEEICQADPPTRTVDELLEFVVGSAWPEREPASHRGDAFALEHQVAFCRPEFGARRNVGELRQEPRPALDMAIAEFRCRESGVGDAHDGAVAGRREVERMERGGRTARRNY